MYISYNGEELSKYINVLKGFTTKIGANWEPELLDIGNVSRGERFKKTTYKSKKMPMPFELKENTQAYYDEVQRILNVDEPKPLIIGGEVNRVYMAVPSGTLNFDDIIAFGSGEIEWIIPSSYAESTSEKTAKNNGSNTITLQNNGNDSVPVSVKVTMKSDNGFIGITLGDRFYQIGNPEEVDGYEYEMTEKLFDDHLYEDKGWLVNQGITPPVTPERLQNGVVRYVKEYENEGYVRTEDYASGNSWHGASVTKIVPTDSNGEYPTNWKSSYRFDFNPAGMTNKGIAVGHNSMTYSDADGNIILSIVIEDNNPTYEKSDLYIYVEDKRVLALKNTDQFYDTLRGDAHAVDIEKIGDQITIRYGKKGINKTYILSNPDRELRKMTWYGAAYQTYQFMRNNLLRAANCYKHNVDKFEDIPNYFANGDVVEIDGETGDVFINDVYNMDMADIGSQPLLLPPGQHTLGIVTSSFSSVPDVEVSFKERWL